MIKVLGTCKNKRTLKSKPIPGNLTLQQLLSLAVLKMDVSSWSLSLVLRSDKNKSQCVQDDCDNHKNQTNISPKDHSVFC